MPMMPPAPAPDGPPGPPAMGQGGPQPPQGQPPQGVPGPQPGPGPGGPPPGAMPGLPPPPQPDTTTVTFDAVLGVMRDDRMRGFRIDIETDSTIAADENEYKQRLGEFLTGVATFLEKVMPVGQSHPELVPFLGETLTTLVRGFRVGRQLEGTIEDAVSTLSDKAAQLQQSGPPPNPEIEAKKADAQSKMAVAQIRASAEAAKADAETKIAAISLQHQQAQFAQNMREMEANAQAHQQTMQLAQAKHEAEMQKLAMEQRAAELEHMRAQQSHDREMQMMALQQQSFDPSRLAMAQAQAGPDTILEAPAAPEPQPQPL